MAKFIGKFDNSMLEDMVEFDKRYKDTFVFLKLPEQPEFLCLNHGNKGDKALFFHDTYGEILLDSFTDIDVSVRWPKQGLFQLDYETIFVCRVPERQWKRGPCSKNLKMYSPIRLIQSVTDYTTVSIDTLERAFSEDRETTTRIIDAINAFKGSLYASIRLNNDFFLSLPPYRNKHYLLWYRTIPVAIVEPGDKRIIIKYSHIKQEITDFLRDFEGDSWQII